MRFTMAILCLAAASAVPAAENRQQLQFLLSDGPKPNLSKDQWTQLLSGISKQQWVQILGNFNKAAGRSLDQEAGERQLANLLGLLGGGGLGGLLGSNLASSLSNGSSLASAAGGVLGAAGGAAAGNAGANLITNGLSSLTGVKGGKGKMEKGKERMEKGKERM